MGMIKQKQEITPERIQDISAKLISARKMLTDQKEFVRIQGEKLIGIENQLMAAQKDYDAMIESFK
jgi:hypothetical protein